MNNGSKSLSINETFIIESVEDVEILSACTGFYTSKIVSCSGNTEILLGVNSISTNSSFSATTYYGDGSNLTGISTQDTFVTGGTYNENTGVATFKNNTGGTFSVTGFYTGATDVYVTAVTFTNNLLTLFRNDGVSFGANINNFTSLNVNGPVSATTFYGDGSNLSGISTQDTFVTGGTYSNGTAIFTNNTGGTFNVNGFTTPFTGGTVSGSTVFTDGLTANTISATTYQNLSSNFKNEIHVSQVDGNDTTGTGALLNPVASITKALTLITGQGRTIVIHPGNYTENPSITTQYTVLTTYEVIGGNTLLTGTLSTSTGCSITGLKMTNLTITAPTGTGNVNILNCDITGTLTKNNTADYTLIRFCDIGTINITGGNLVAIFGGNPNFITVNNAAARVIVKAAVTIAPVLTAGSLSLVDSIVVAAVTNAFTSSAGTFTTLANSQFLISALNNVAPVVLNGFYSILNCVYDKPNSTLVALSSTGGSTNSIDYFQYINADKFITQGGTSSKYVMGDGSLSNGFTGGTITGATNFTNGLTANTISATTYQNLPIDIRVTGGTYYNTSGTTIFTNNTGGTFSVTGFYTGATDVYVTAVTFTNNLLTLYRNDGVSFGANINNFTSLNVNGPVSATTFYGDGSNLSGITSLGAVTSVSALTLTSVAATDLSSTVANPTTTPVITLNVPDASATARGVITISAQTLSGDKDFTSRVQAEGGFWYTESNVFKGQILPISGDTFYNVLTNKTHYFGMGNGVGVANIPNNLSVANGNFSILNQTASTIASFDISKNVVSLPLATYPNLDELKTLKGITTGTTIQSQIDATNVNVITITTTGSVTTDTTSGGYGQHGRHVKISNGANAINIECVSGSNANFVASYEKIGSGAITFTSTLPISIVQLTGTNQLTGVALVGSKACLSRNGDIYYLQITNY